ncbi:cytidine deaminase [Reinekea marina]|uniref:Cytidine deaminase n=1 Tax=Reinekea marina TaxID=1310421 RepID=A0ABV7WUF9_9GAMM|nr:cytidine deaminase [Reinekea marina]MDN3650835.1 cytidine deaminase [Reinekea marina]
MNIEQKLYDSALNLLKHRYPKGDGYAAAVRTESGKILTSVPPDTKNDSLNVCIELGAYLEAFKLDEAITHSLCICRKDEDSEVIILSPCGICQERLVFWGGDVKAAISTKDNKLIFKTIRELMPHHWSVANGEAL